MIISNLKELIEHHIEEEESEIFDVARDVIEDPNEVGQTFVSMKKEAKITI